MHPVPAIGGPAAHAHLKALTTVEPRYVLPLSWTGLRAFDFGEERQQAHDPDKGLTQVVAAFPATWRAVPPWEVLLQQSYGCSPPAHPNVLPLREPRALGSPHGTSGEPGLARDIFPSHVPNADQRWLSGEQAPVAARPELAGLWLKGCGHMRLVAVHNQEDHHATLSSPAPGPSVWHGLVRHGPARAGLD